MAEPQNDRRTPEQNEETSDPRNPPQSVVNTTVRRAVLGSYLGPLVAFVVIVGLALLYWANRGPVQPDPDRAPIGTTGAPDDRDDVVGERGNVERTPGGFEPAPRPGSTADELEYRGGDRLGASAPGSDRSATITNLAMLEGEPKDLVGRRVEIRDVNVVEAADPSHFWIQDGHVKAEVSAPRGGPRVSSQSRVTVSGTVEEDGRGGARIRAERVDAS